MAQKTLEMKYTEERGGGVWCIVWNYLRWRTWWRWCSLKRRNCTGWRWFCHERLLFSFLGYFQRRDIVGELEVESLDQPSQKRFMRGCERHSLSNTFELSPKSAKDKQGRQPRWARLPQPPAVYRRAKCLHSKLLFCDWCDSVTFGTERSVWEDLILNPRGHMAGESFL